MHKGDTLILAREFDVNARTIADAVTCLGGRVKLLLRSLSLRDSVTIIVDGNDESTSVETVCGEYKRRLDFCAISSVWCRGFDNDFGVHPGTVPNFIMYEWKYYWKYLRGELRGAKWINGITAMRDANDRINQLCVAKRCGFAVPSTLVTTSRAEADAFLSRFGRAVVKRISAGGMSEHPDRLLLAQVIDMLPDDLPQTFICPIMLQEVIEKHIELRVTVVGNDVYPSALYFSHDDLRADCADAKRLILDGNVYARHRIDLALEKKLVALVRSMGLLFGAIDMAIDKSGRAVFFEINPSGQWLAIEEHTGYPIAERIAHELLAN